MINKRFVKTALDINTGDPIILDVELIQINSSVTGNTDTRYLYPQQIQIINDTEAGIEWLSLNSEEEYNQYILSPSSFTFVRLPSGFTLQDDFTSFGRCYKFIIKAYQTTAVSDLTIEFINYK
jgi:hypothetical protein